MSLYLCVFDDDEELDGIDVGAYSDFGYFHDSVAGLLEGGKAGSRFPVLMLRSGSDTEWNTEDCRKLKGELETVSAEFKQHPPKEFFAEWQRGVAKKLGLRPTSLYDCFIDVDGEPVLERLANLVHLALRRNLPILFQ